MSSGVVLGTAVAAGCVLHQIVKNNSVDLYPLSILSCLIVAHCLVALGLQQTSDIHGDFWAAQRLAFCATSCAILSLWTNMLIYRTFFHPLNHFPGPFGAKLSKFWSLRQVVRSKSRWYRVCVDLHKKYGDYVRTGPNELVICDPAALGPLLGVRNQKGPFYGATQKSLHTNQDQEFHRQRRKIWDMAFKQTLTDYGPRIEEFTDTLLTRLDKTAGQEVLVNEFCLHYTWDVMSGIGYGSETRFLEGESGDFAKTLVAKIKEGIAAISLLAHVPWLLTVAESLTFLGGPLKMFRTWSQEQVKRRRLMKNPRPDIMGHLLEHTADDAEGRELLDADSRLIIGAGSDTTVSGLVVLFLHLAYYHDYQDKVREEVEQSFADKTYTCARPQTLLDAVIHESLRVAPPILFNLQRYPPKGGLQIGDVYIPEGTNCCMGAYQMHHDPRNFPQPDQFIPERWTTRPELITNKEAFIPFNMGPYMCPGRGVAMMEMRSVIARTVQRYDISFPPGMTDFNIQEYLMNIKDHFIAGVPELKLVFTLRK